MHKLQRYCCVALLGLMVFALPALADWNVGDPYKMHFPQLPDPNGWDVEFAHWVQPDPPTLPSMRLSNLLADDWRCSQTGPVSDVHFWVSMFDDHSTGGNIPFQLSSLSLTFWNDMPAGPNNEFSHPKRDAAIKTYDLLPSQFSVRRWGFGPQGWYNPNPGSGEYIPPPNHEPIYQINVPQLVNPFIQQQGSIYWLEIDAWATVPGTTEPVRLGWKTADLTQYPDPYKGAHFQDDAVYMKYMRTGPSQWEFAGYGDIVLPPQTGGISRDMAFVITPEPGTIAMLVGAGLVGLGLLVRRRRGK